MQIFSEVIFAQDSGKIKIIIYDAIVGEALGAHPPPPKIVLKP